MDVVSNINGYHVEGGRGTFTLQVRLISAGLTVQNGAIRGDALRQRAHSTDLN